MKQINYDMIIIGGGQAGIPLAHALAKAGQQVALVERSRLGGSCVNFGCTPTKAAIASARLAHQARRAVQYGLSIPDVRIDFPAVLKRAKSIAAESREGLEKNFEKGGNPELLVGQARLDGRDERGLFRVKVNDAVYTANRVLLNTGTRTLIPQLAGVDDVPYIHAGNWLEHSELPEHLVVLGGGYIALEMGQFYRRMGSRVTIVEAEKHIARGEDQDVAAEIQTLLADEGIEFRLNAKGREVKNENGGVILTIDEGGATNTIAATNLFISTGRRPNTDDLGLETVGVKTDDRGIVKADERLATNIDGIYVAGDIRGGPQFTHTSWDDYRILESQLIGDGSRTTKRIVPYAIFIDPELGRVGMTEREARAAGKEIKVSRFDMNKNGKAREIGETRSFIKVIADARTDKILGAAVLANEGAELVHIYIDLMNADAPYTILRDAIHIHPTLAEAVQSAVKML